MDVSKFKTLISHTNLSDAVSAIYEDAKDTFDNTTKVIDVLTTLYDGLIEGSMPESEFNDFCLTNMPIRICATEDGEHTLVGYITWDGLEGAIVLKSAATGNPTIMTIANYHSEIPGVVTFWNVMDLDAVVGGWSLKRIAEATTNSLNCSSLIMDVCDTLASRNGNYLSAFKDKTDSYAAKLTAGSRVTYQKICDALAVTATSKVAAASYLINLYRGLSTVSGNNELGSLSFSDTDYYVEGFFGTNAIGVVITVATTIASALLMAINPIVGIIAASFSGLTNLFLSYTKEVTYADVSLDVLNRDFAVPILQVKTLRSIVEANLNTIALREWYARLSVSGYLSVRMPGIHLMQWIDDSYVYTEGYISCDLAAYEGCDLNVGHLYNYENILGEITTMSVGNLTSIEDSRDAWYSMMESTQAVIANMKGVTESDDQHLIRCVSASLFVIITTVLSVATPDATLQHRLTHIYDRPDGVTCANIQYIGDVLWLLNCLIEFDSRMTWEWLVNNIIPFVREWLSNFSVMTFMNVYDALYTLFKNDVEQESEAYYSLVTYSENLGDYTGPFARPPKYASTAFMNTVLIGVATAAATIGIGVAAWAVRRKIQLWALRKQTDIEAAKYRYEANPTDANWAAYERGLKKYNLSTLFTGYNKLSYVSGAEIDRASGAVSSNLASARYSADVDINGLKKIIRPW